MITHPTSSCIACQSGTEGGDFSENVLHSCGQNLGAFETKVHAVAEQNTESSGTKKDIENPQQTESLESYRDLKAMQNLDLINNVKMKLDKYAKSLLTCGTRNPSILLKNINAKTSVDLSALNNFGSEFSEQFIERCFTEKGCVSLSPTFAVPDSFQTLDSLGRDLAKLNRNMTEINRENGTYDLFLGYPFLSGSVPGSKKYFRAPVFLLPVKLAKISPDRGPIRWVLNIASNAEPVINRTLFLALAKEQDISINSKIFEETVPKEIFENEDLMSAVHQLLLDFGMSCSLQRNATPYKLSSLAPFDSRIMLIENLPSGLVINPVAILGYFPQSRSSIFSDFEKLQELNPEKLKAIWPLLSDSYKQSLLSAGFGRKGSSSKIPSPWEEVSYTAPKTVDERKEKDNFYLMPSNPSQDKILLELENPNSKGLVIWGPPGTGKSQTIVNIIGSCLAKNWKVLVVSQKRAALDVVYQRMQVLGLDSMVALIHDSYHDRAKLFEKIRDLTSSDSQQIKVNIENNDLSDEIDRLKDMIVKVYKSLQDDTCGISFSKLYQTAGSSDTLRLFEIDPEWKNKTDIDLNGALSEIDEFLKYKSIRSELSIFKSRRSFDIVTQSDVNGVCKTINSILNDSEYREAAIVLQALAYTPLEIELVENPSDRMSSFYRDYQCAYQDDRISRFASISYWNAKRRMKEYFAWASQVATGYAGKFIRACEPLFDLNEVEKIAKTIIAGRPNCDELKGIHDTSANSFYEIKSYDQRMKGLSKESLDIIRLFESTEANFTVEEWKKAFRRAVYKLWIDKLEEKHEDAVVWLRSGNFESLVNEYNKLLDRKKVHSRESLFTSWRNQIVSSDRESFNRWIYADVSRNQNSMSIRKLNERYLKNDFYRDLFPVWMASPESVSSVFPLEENLFDVIIFDEASQCTVEEAIPTIFRGKKIIIAGDDKQLTPTDLFRVQFDLGDDDESFPDEPSLLAMAIKNTNYKQFMLDWHYRSRYEELIRFSNAVFYSSRIKFAPNITPFQPGNSTAINWVSVEGYWEDQENRVEAEKVVDRMKYHLSERPGESLGIITFNKKQKDLIERVIDERRALDLEFSSLLELDAQKNIDEQWFVKNIENVQGDERDTIIFSIAYAPTEPGGRVAVRFGTLNGRGGENRLNVAITRAAKRIEIVASFDPDLDMDSSTSAHQGPKVFHDYLRYAKAVAGQNFERAMNILNKYSVQVKKDSGQDVFDSDFESEVFSAVLGLGYKVHTQVGQSGYRIDLAIVHPQDPGRYLLAVECDGAAFHSSKSAREHDKYRQDFLQSKGWSIHRIWSTNWWYNKDKELAKLRAAVEAALRNDQQRLK